MKELANHHRISHRIAAGHLINPDREHWIGLKVAFAVKCPVHSLKVERFFGSSHFSQFVKHPTSIFRWLLICSIFFCFTPNLLNNVN